jgi:hypothetical protein
METNFEKVSKLNRLIGNVRHPLNEPNWDDLAAQLGIIRQEFEELEEAVQKRDIRLLRDATGDLLVTAYGMGYRAGIDVDADMEEIQQSNLSKFCHSMEEALQTGAKYEELGVLCSYRHLPEGLIAVVSAQDQYGKDGKHYPKGKLLKSVNFREPNLD